MSSNSTTESPVKKRFALAMLSLVVLISIGSCMVGINAFFEQERRPVRKFSLMQGNPSGVLQIDATVTAVDPVRDTMKVRLEFHPKGDLLEKNGHDIARDVHVLTTNTSGPAEFILKKHHEPHPVELTLNLYDGDVSNYPIDEYKADLQIETFLEAGSEDETPVPMIINFTAKNHVLEVRAEMAASGEAHELDLLLHLKRPAVVKGFAWFVNGLMVMMALCSVIVAFNVAYRGKKLEPNLLVWMSALLFVLPSLRATLPGAPPIGALTDFLVFFWVEGAIALCLFIMVLTWYGRVPDNAVEKG